MPKGTNQKLKLYRLAQIMLEKAEFSEKQRTMESISNACAILNLINQKEKFYAGIR